MGLFGSKKEEPKMTVQELFGTDCLEEIKAVIGPKYAANGYPKKYMDFAGVILEAADHPDRECTKKEFGTCIFAAGCFTKLEPELEPMLTAAIKKYKKM
ncbi:MAG: hypothetical protein IJM62_02610 [Lachnospiraceae bacterium]|nr:hypothetical protein [Lachnospiraceae bacterium]